MTVAVTDNLYAQVPSVEAKIDLSLDELIKQRKQAKKQQQRESVKTSNKSIRLTNPKNQQSIKKSKIQHKQAALRNALVNNKRGLPPVAKGKMKKLIKSKNGPVGRQLQQPNAQHLQTMKERKRGKNTPKSNAMLTVKKTETNAVVPSHLKKKPIHRLKQAVESKPSRGKSRQVARSPKESGLQLHVTIKKSKAELRRLKQKQPESKRRPQKNMKQYNNFLLGRKLTKLRRHLERVKIKQPTTKNIRSRKVTNRNGRVVIRKTMVVRKA